MPRRGENIYKRKDGRWEARYVKEVMADGKKRYGSVYADNYKDVKAKQPLNVAKELMGHSDISVTAKIYTHMVDEVFE